MSRSWVKHWAEFFRQERIRQGISQLDLADMVGVHRSQVTNWENHRRQPEAGNFAAWAAALGCVVEVHVKEEDELLEIIVKEDGDGRAAD